MKKYQTGIQKTVFEVIKQSKKLDFEYITKKQITAEVIVKIPELKNSEDKIGQALYQLQRQTKFRRPRIKKYCKDGKQLGWTIVGE